MTILLAPSNALRGVDVGLSVSESVDLARLGLMERHCVVAVAELARAVLISGGTATYGGHLGAGGFTHVLMTEARRFSERKAALTICLPEYVHREIDDRELGAIDRRLGDVAEILCLSSEGEAHPVKQRPPAKLEATAIDVAGSLTNMRRYVTSATSARVLIGGKVTGYMGRMPGLFEEALMALEKRQPLYVAGGFGGAAAAIAMAFGYDDYSWAPRDFPDGMQSDAGAQEALAVLRRSAADAVDNGLSDEERSQLAATHRAGDIASLVVRGLSRRRAAAG